MSINCHSQKTLNNKTITQGHNFIVISKIPYKAVCTKCGFVSFIKPKTYFIR